MTERIAGLRKYFITQRGHRAFRKKEKDPFFLASGFARHSEKDTVRAVKRLVWMLNEETPVIVPGQRILFLRTNPTLQALFTEEEKKALESRYRLHELGELSNICVDYTHLLNTGFPGMLQKLEAQKKLFGQEAQREYVDGQISILHALLDLIDRYRMAASGAGNQDGAESLARLISDKPRTFRDALQMQRIIHFTMWCAGNYHNTLGRFDQYMMPYLQADLDAGTLTEETALELLEEYFLSFNIDSDLYPGMQQGDNGQSMALGGVTPEGEDGFQLLSRLCLQASLELKLIDPKINLRVSRDTPLAIYELGTQLTKQGLGFPQYSNDDIVIKGLTDLGYAPEDARNYTVAACWEFIIPGKGMEIPNIDALCFATEMRDAVVSSLMDSPDYETLFDCVEKRIQARVDKMCENTKNLYIFPAPFLSLMMDSCLEKGQDISLGGIYNNYGFHGTGLATAADSLAAIRKYVFETGEVTKADLLDAMERDFEGHQDLLHLLRYEAPKMGNNEALPDTIACDLLNAFAKALRGKRNERGGGYRPGTGSAMYYLWYSREMGATPDGRRAGEGFSCNYSPSLFIHSKGPVSVVKSFTKPDLSRVINGGPLTIELHDTLFRGEESIAKVAALVKSYIDLGGHQMQINAVNRDTMLDAQKHPENYHNLIVRVWGWSGYFVELDKEYQDHIIKRMELTV
jgi:Pyruvate-formate lyase